MRPSVQCLQALSRAIPRSKSTSFIGLGRMGYQMAYNLFSKQYLQANESGFIVCDALPDTARAFCEDFTRQYPDAQISIAATVDEYVAALSPWTDILLTFPFSLFVQSNFILQSDRNNASVVPSRKEGLRGRDHPYVAASSCVEVWRRDNLYRFNNLGRGCCAAGSEECH